MGQKQSRKLVPIVATPTSHQDTNRHTQRVVSPKNVDTYRVIIKLEQTALHFQNLIESAGRTLTIPVTDINKRFFQYPCAFVFNGCP